MALIGLLWVWASLQNLPLPGSINIDWRKQQVKKMLENQDFAQVIPTASAALQSKPLDWEFYFIRATARLHTGDRVGAAGDFRRARILETSYAETPWNEGRLWFPIQPTQALLVWQESLKRSQPDVAVQRYQEILELILKQPALLAPAHRLALGNPRLEAIWLETALPAEFEQDLKAPLKLDPHLLSFSDLEQARFFGWWTTKTDLPNFIQMLEHHPTWQKNGLRAAASVYAAQNNSEAACKLAHRFTALPVLPPLMQEANARELQRRLLLNPSDFSAGYALYVTQMKSGHENDALNTLEQITTEAKCPTYFYYLLAQLWGDRKEWERSWKALTVYVKTQGS